MQIGKQYLRDSLQSFDMLPFDISQADLDLVKMNRKSHISPIVRDRCLAIILTELGYGRQASADIIGCSRNTVTNYVRMFVQYGVSAILQVNYRGKVHQLHGQFTEIVEELMLPDNVPATVQQAREWLADKYDYVVSKESVRKLLHRLGFRYKKWDVFAGNAKKLDEWLLDQEAFLEKLEPLMSKADAGEVDLVFTDAAHFVYGKFSGRAWLNGRQFKATGHGRWRLNVYGAYDVSSGHILTHYGQNNVDAEFVVNYLTWLRSEHYLDRDKPLHLVLDNARYQHCALVKEHAQSLNILLEFLPSYSPNLNLIERLWRYLKNLMGQAFYFNKEEFHDTIVHLLESLDKDSHRRKLQPLMTRKFQRFDNAQISGC